jgi:hypothetical protein
VARHARRWAEAAQRGEAVREQASDSRLGYVQGAHAFREGGDLALAEVLLAEALRHFPDDRELLTSAAAIATQGQSWTQAWRRWRGVRIRFTDHRIADLLEARALFRLKGFEEAEMVALAGTKLFPDDGELVIEAARCATKLQRPAASCSVLAAPLALWERAFRLAPNIPAAGMGYAKALTEASAMQRAEEIQAELDARFPAITPAATASV